MDTHIHEQLCVIEDGEESLLCEVAAGGCQVAVPRLKWWVQGFQVTFDFCYLSRLKSWYPEIVHKKIVGASLKKEKGGGEVSKFNWISIDSDVLKVIFNVGEGKCYVIGYAQGSIFQEMMKYQ